MDINIRVRVDSPDIMNALLALAEALPQMKTGVQVKEETKEVQASKEKEEVKTTTLEEVRAVLAQLAQNGKQKGVKELIKKFGGKKLTDIPKDKYPELLKEAELI
ncbi:rRNA biogenesis protein rrp5 [Clostridium tyrobutyricum]|uniref:rRNA biogenesis protein rrp5 n=1 Tax=Clostridium tyrobutyricum TaxID=1519 RepID=UPI001C381D7E|nr:rRNA biogenesis protein rrp5 [Clostridium tyrobutyricum]MBV4417477.1 rRNA biogenesis protein rrp5 [Clostridium tyrobutyricum]MBV4423093.1 rRNA biogenesis protein rrp5 [Clostridium tyrobutyricum]